MKRLTTPVLMVASLFALAACTDPIIGEWESKETNACGERSDFEVDDDLKVEGTIWVEDPGAGVCYKCEFDGEFDDAEDDKYKGDIDLNDCTICNGTKHDAECKINDDEDELDCEVDFGCGTMDDEFEKKGD